MLCISSLAIRWAWYLVIFSGLVKLVVMPDWLSSQKSSARPRGSTRMTLYLFAISMRIWCMPKDNKYPDCLKCNLRFICSVIVVKGSDVCIHAPFTSETDLQKESIDAKT